MSSARASARDGLTRYRLAAVRATAFYWHFVNVISWSSLTPRSPRCETRTSSETQELCSGSGCSPRRSRGRCSSCRLRRDRGALHRRGPGWGVGVDPWQIALMIAAGAVVVRRRRARRALPRDRAARTTTSRRSGASLLRPRRPREHPVPRDHPAQRHRRRRPRPVPPGMKRAALLLLALAAVPAAAAQPPQASSRASPTVRPLRGQLRVVPRLARRGHPAAGIAAARAGSSAGPPLRDVGALAPTSTSAPATCRCASPTSSRPHPRALHRAADPARSSPTSRRSGRPADPAGRIPSAAASARACASSPSTAPAAIRSSREAATSPARACRRSTRRRRCRSPRRCASART